MSHLNEEDYWPECLVVELKTLVRKEKFDFNVVSSKLVEWWQGNAGDEALASQSLSLTAVEKSGYDINAKTCREAFARDYSRAPYNLGKASSSLKEKTTPLPVVVSVSAEDEEEASKFDFGEREEEGGKIGERGKEQHQQHLSGGTSAVPQALPVTDGPDLSYEEVLENAERIEEENFRRKEVVFTRVAKLLMLEGYGDEDGENTSPNEDGLDRLVAMNKSSNPMDAEVIRAFQEGRKKRHEEKIKRKKQQAEAEEWKRIGEDRERLRRRFDEGSEDAEGEAFNFTSSSPSKGGAASKQEEAELALYEQYVRSMIGAAGAPSGSTPVDPVFSAVNGAKMLETDSKNKVHQEIYRQLIVDTIAAKYHGELAAVRDGSGVNANLAQGTRLVGDEAAVEPVQEQKKSTSSSVNLSGGFLDSDEFEDILSALEAEQASMAQDKGDAGGAGEAASSDLADVLAILDAAASGKGTASTAEDDSVAVMLKEMSAFGNDLPTAPKSGKVILRAGMGSTRRPDEGEAQQDAPSSLPTPPGPTSSTGNKQNGNGPGSRNSSRPIGAPQGRMNGGGGGRGDGRMKRAEVERQVEESDSDDEDDADSNWKTRRAAAKAKAAQDAGTGGANAPSGSGVYGFGGAGEGALQAGAHKKKVVTASVSGVSIERSSDKVMPPAPPQSKMQSDGEEESKNASAGGSTPCAPVNAAAGGPSSPSSSTGSVTPDTSGIWNDVLSPAGAAAGSGSAGKNQSPAAKNLSREVEAEANIVPVKVGSAVEVSNVGGLLGGGGGRATRSKGKMPIMKK
jgi:hypothetical protein